jgi:hypothetical protein
MAIGAAELKTKGCMGRIGRRLIILLMAGIAVGPGIPVIACCVTVGTFWRGMAEGQRKEGMVKT